MHWPAGRAGVSTSAEHRAPDLIGGSAMLAVRRSPGSPRVAPVQRAAAGPTEGLRGWDRPGQRGREASAWRWPPGWSIYSASSSESPARFKPAPPPRPLLEPATIQGLRVAPAPSRTYSWRPFLTRRDSLPRSRRDSHRRSERWTMEWRSVAGCTHCALFISPLSYHPLCGVNWRRMQVLISADRRTRGGP
jgi:hypothetical protein